MVEGAAPAGLYDDDDLFYAFTLTEESRLEISSAVPFLATQPSIYVLGEDCQPIVLNERGGPGISLAQLFLLPGNYRLQVVATSRFTLTIVRRAESRPAGGECTRPLLLVPDGSGAVSVTGSTASAAWTLLSPTCTSAPTPVVMYALDLPQRSLVTLTTTPLDAGTAVELGTRQGCDGYRPACFVAQPGVADVRSLPATPPGRLFLFVDTEATPGEYRLDVQVNPWALNDTCEAAEDLAFDGGTAFAQGDTRYAVDQGCECSFRCRGRHVYRFDTTGQGERSFRALATSLDGGAAPAVGLLGACFGTPLDCDYSPSPLRGVAGAPRLPEGTYWVEVAGGVGPFRLDVALGAPEVAPPNDTCALAEVIDLTTVSAASRTGTTIGAGNEFSVSCGAASTGNGADVAFDIRTPPRGLLELDATPAAAEFDLSVHTSDLLCAQSTGWTCANAAGPAGTETISVRLNATNRTTVLVDGVDGTRGPFTLNARFTPPPTNDACVLPLPVLPVGGSVTGDNSLGDNSLGCGTNGPDVFYTFTPTSNGTYTFTLTPSGFDGALHLLSSCASSSCLSTANAAGVGAAETLTASLSRTVTYVLAVDAAYVANGGGGAFTLRVQ